jgi:hypothetical protein
VAGFQVAAAWLPELENGASTLRWRLARESGMAISTESERSSRDAPTPLSPPAAGDRSGSSVPDDRVGKRGWPVFEAAVGLVVSVVALIPMANLTNPSFPFDDAYISFAYAARLAAGHGLRLTAGSPPVEAFTDPLWVCLMAFGKVIGIPIPTWARIVDLVLIAALAGTTAALARRINPRVPPWMAAAAGALVGLVPATIFHALGGLEVLLFGVLLNAVLLALLADRTSNRAMSWMTSGLCFLLFLTRPEGALVWGVAWCVAWAWQREVKAQLRSAAYFVVPVIAVEFGRLAYFHQLVPNSVVTKSGDSMSASVHLIRQEVHHFISAYAPLVVVVAVVSLLAIILWRRLTPIVAILPVLVALTLFEVAVSAGDNYPYERYLLPLLAPAAALAVGGLSQLGWRATTNPGARRPGRRLAGLRVLSTVAVAATLGGTWVTAHRRQEAFTSTHSILAIGRAWPRISPLFSADRLAQHAGIYPYPLSDLLLRTAQPGDLLATDEPGILAYYTRVRILDIYGLANTHIARLPGAPGHRTDPDYLFGQRPKFFVDHPGIPDDLVYTNDVRLLGYRLVAFVPDAPTRAPVIALFERDPTISVVNSLDAAIPDAQRQVEVMPAPLANDFALTPGSTSAIIQPTPTQIEAGALALRTNFTALAAGASAQLALPPDAGTGCRAAVTALSPGSAVPQRLSLTLTSADPATKPTHVDVDLGTAAAAKAVAVDLPSNSSNASHLSLNLGPGPGSAVSVAQWAEPRIVCGPSGT